MIGHSWWTSLVVVLLCGGVAACSSTARPGPLSAHKGSRWIKKAVCYQTPDAKVKVPGPVIDATLPHDESPHDTGPLGAATAGSTATSLLRYSSSCWRRPDLRLIHRLALPSPRGDVPRAQPDWRRPTPLPASCQTSSSGLTSITGPGTLIATKVGEKCGLRNAVIMRCRLTIVWQ